jgi:hypothetical protein
MWFTFARSDGRIDQQVCDRSSYRSNGHSSSRAVSLLQIPNIANYSRSDLYYTVGAFSLSSTRWEWRYSAISFCDCVRDSGVLLGVRVGVAAVRAWPTSFWTDFDWWRYANVHSQWCASFLCSCKCISFFSSFCSLVFQFSNSVGSDSKVWAVTCWRFCASCWAAMNYHLAYTSIDWDLFTKITSMSWCYCRSPCRFSSSYCFWKESIIAREKTIAERKTIIYSTISGVCAFISLSSLLIVRHWTLSDYVQHFAEAIHQLSIWCDGLAVDSILVCVCTAGFEWRI